jgi:hypothetical protein
MLINKYGAVGGMRLGKGNRSTWRKPAPVAITDTNMTDVRTSEVVCMVTKL